MADGNCRGQRGFGFPERAPASALRAGEIVVDLFAGGGGASEALRQALGRDPDIAINHDATAIGMHAANHPFTRHMCEDVWQADPRHECGARAVGWLHASPDCTHFSQAKGGQPRSRATRALSWVVLKWAGAVRPRIISLENVEQILKWGPLIAKRDKATGRVLKLDGSIAARGERVPIGEQFLIPDKTREGSTWQHFVAALRALGYVVEWRKLRACDFGAGTSRTRLFMVARCDGEEIRWPSPTHGAGLAPFVTAADCIDWTIDCPSIFTRARPLADATNRRIARGIRKFVLDAAEPFIVPNNTNNAPQSTTGPLPTVTTCQGRNLLVTPILTEHANASRAACWRADEPLRTQCANVKGGHFAVAAATLVASAYGEGSGPTKRRGSGAHDVAAPLGTVTVGGSGGHAVVTAFLDQAYGGGANGRPAPARSADEPLSTTTASGAQQRLVTAHMAKLRGTSHSADVSNPLHTVSAGGEHHALVECTLAPEQESAALRVAAFLVNYYGNGQALDLAEPADTITTRDRLALVTVHVRGVPYVIVDIGLRMLKPQELYAAQGFPHDYIFDRTADGRRLTGTQAVRMVGNSVSPPPLAAIARANLDEIRARLVA